MTLEQRKRAQHEPGAGDLAVPSVHVERCEIPEVLLVTPKRFRDARGFFSETFSQRAFQDIGIADAFVQDNQSLSVEAGTVRGFHFQKPPHAQAKLVRVTRGRILDYALDLRRGASTFGRHVTRELSADNWAQLYIPVGFAHAFCTLEPNTEVVYKVSDYYAPASERGIRWNDPALGIAWPDVVGAATLSAKDATLPRLADLDFTF